MHSTYPVHSANFSRPTLFNLRSSRLQDYGLFNCSIHHRHSWSWCYRGCWHQPCPPILKYSSILLSSLHCLPFGVGNFRACCRPWTWAPSLSRPLRKSDRRLPLPVVALVVLYTTNKLIGLRLILLLSRCFPRLLS